MGVGVAVVWVHVLLAPRAVRMCKSLQLCGDTVVF